MQRSNLNSKSYPTVIGSRRLCYQGTPSSCATRRRTTTLLNLGRLGSVLIEKGDPKQLGVSQNQGYLFGCSQNKNYSILGSILGCPLFWETISWSATIAVLKTGLWFGCIFVQVTQWFQQFSARARPSEW